MFDELGDVVRELGDVAGEMAALPFDILSDLFDD